MPPASRRSLSTSFHAGVDCWVSPQAKAASRRRTPHVASHAQHNSGPVLCTRRSPRPHTKLAFTFRRCLSTLLRGGWIVGSFLHLVKKGEGSEGSNLWACLDLGGLGVCLETSEKSLSELCASRASEVGVPEKSASTRCIHGFFFGSA